MNWDVQSESVEGEKGKTERRIRAERKVDQSKDVKHQVQEQLALDFEDMREKQPADKGSSKPKRKEKNNL